MIPSTCVEVHGLQVDTVARTVTLPKDKCDRAVALLQSLCYRRSAKLPEIQCLIGTLNFAMRAIKVGWGFLRCLIDLTMGVTQPPHHIHLNKEARKDIEMWLVLLEHFNGTSLMKAPDWSSSNAIKLYSDSSNKGFAMVLGRSGLMGSGHLCGSRIILQLKSCSL